MRTRRVVLWATVVGLVSGYLFGLLAKPEYIWHVRVLAAGWMGLCAGFVFHTSIKR